MTTDPGMGNHLYALKLACDNTDGPILECGTGHWSTPFLHSYAIVGRKVVSFESHEYWVQQTRSLFQNHGHEIHKVPVSEDLHADWNMMPWDLYDWGVVFVDQSPVAGRLVALSALLMLRSKAVVVVHDTDNPRYFFGPLLNYFRCRGDTKALPRTTIVTNREKFPWK